MTKLASLLLLLLLPAMTVMAAKDKVVSDDLLYDQVRRKLANDADVKGGALQVTVVEGVVTIKGVLEKESQKSRAEKLVSKVHGVKKVINEIRLGPPGTR
jgi:osmotically-inducible protein OsmY